MVHTLYWNFHICYLLFSLGTWMLGPWIKRNWKWSTEDGKSKDQHFRNQWTNVVSKSLIWFSVDGRGCVPSRLLSLRRKTSRTLKKKQIWGILTLKKTEEPDWFDLLAVQGTLKCLFQYHSSKASIVQYSAFLIVQLSYLYMTTGKA